MQNAMCMHITHKKRMIGSHYHMGDSVLQTVSNHTYLGMDINSKLSWEKSCKIPRPHFHRTRGYLYMLIPHQLTPPPPPLSREKDIQGYIPYLGYWLPLAITKKIPFSCMVFLGNLPETTAPNTPFPEKMPNGNPHVAPYAFEWGAGVQNITSRTNQVLDS